MRKIVLLSIAVGSAAVRYNFGPKISTTLKSVIVQVVPEDPSHPVRVGKYMSNCYAQESLGIDEDELEKEYNFLLALNNTGITPNVYELVPSQQLAGCFYYVAISGFVMQNPQMCQWSNLTSMTLELLGPELGDMYRPPHGANSTGWIAEVVDEKSALGFAKGVLSVGVKLVSQVSRLHSFGILHGDVHPSNVAFLLKPEGQPYDPVDDQIVLFDFDSAQLIEANPDAPIAKRRMRALREVLLSPWHLRNERLGRRDDVFRALQVVAEGLTGAEYNGRIANLFNEADDRVLKERGFTLREFNSSPPSDAKSEAFEAMDQAYFQIKRDTEMIGTDHLGSLKFLSSEVLVEIQKGINGEIMGMFSHWDHPDVVPDYDAIIAVLNRLIRVVSDEEATKLDQFPNGASL